MPAQWYFYLCMGDGMQGKRENLFAKTKYRRALLFTCKINVHPAERQEIESFMLSGFSGIKGKRTHSILTLEDASPQKRRLFCKAQVIRHRNSKLRSTLNVLGFNTWAPAIAEIKNNLEARQYCYTPGLVGYGYETSQCGIVSKVIIVTELVEGAVNLKEFIDRNPEKIKPAILGALNLIGKSIVDGFLHLDCWLGNVLTDDELSEFYFVDLEYCRFNTATDVGRQLAFLISYFYDQDLKKYISDYEYFSIIKPWLEENFNTLNSDDIINSARAASLNIISRKQRLAEF